MELERAVHISLETTKGKLKVLRSTCKVENQYCWIYIQCLLFCILDRKKELLYYKTTTLNHKYFVFSLCGMTATPNRNSFYGWHHLGLWFEYTCINKSSISVWWNRHSATLQRGHFHLRVSPQSPPRNSLQNLICKFKTDPKHPAVKYVFLFPSWHY